MKKKLLVHKKQEKRIVKLALKKGLITPQEVITLYWERYTIAGRRKKGKRNSYGYKYRPLIYYPELFYATVDYWGECMEHSIVNQIGWDVHLSINIMDEDGEFQGPIKSLSRKGLINHLKTLPFPR